MVESSLPIHSSNLFLYEENYLVQRVIDAEWHRLTPSSIYLLKLPQRPQCCPRTEGAGMTSTKTPSVAIQTRRKEYTFTVEPHLKILK